MPASRSVTTSATAVFSVPYWAPSNWSRLCSRLAPVTLSHMVSRFSTPGERSWPKSTAGWESVEALAAYVYSDTHRQVLRRRRQWFERMAEAYAALWWIPRGHIPTTAEAEERVIHLREFGPTPHAFTLREHFPAPDAPGTGPIRSPEGWTCPA